MTLVFRTRSSALLGALALLSGCVPTAGPGSDGDPETPAPQGDQDLLHCTTQAWDVGDTRPVALDLSIDRLTGTAAVVYDRAHAYDQEDPFEFASREWTALAELAAADGELTVSLEGITLSATERAALGTGLWTGSLESEEFGVRDAVCWEDTFAGPHRYDADTGDCVDADGASGLDELPVAYVRASKDGQCGTFPGLSLNEDFLGYPILRGTDLRGADLSEATLFFAHIEDGDFRGANLEGFQFGYATLSGTTDAYTVWPEGPCAVQGDALDCMQ
ncbi:MAG: pentapeptide repeat-containing protein [Deltaproteobacteria bacterium]|nr:pentapeptide repeat-containing protein [Deltaproteobacteria bacterium]